MTPTAPDRTLHRAAGAALAALLLTGSLAACGGGGSSAAEPAGVASTSEQADQGGNFNAADVTFAQSMIPHHQQAIEMAQLAAGQAASAKVKKLAGQIVSAQDPEISTMTDWLTAWGKPLIPDMAGMDHSSMSPEEMAAMGDMNMGASMPGMASDAKLAALKGAEGKAFDQQFLTMMLEHHRGAVEMAGTEKAQGQNPDAVALAGEIITTQNAEIEQIQKLLDKA